MRVMLKLAHRHEVIFVDDHELIRKVLLILLVLIHNDAVFGLVGLQRERIIMQFQMPAISDVLCGCVIDSR